METGISKNEAIRLSQIRSKSKLSYETPEYVYDNKESNIKSGSKKSMDLLKWAGIIAAGTIGTAYLVKSGKGKKAVDFVMNKFEKNIQNLDVTNENGKTVRKIGEKVLSFVKGDDGKFIAKLGDENANIKFIHQGIVSTYKDGRLVSSIKRGQNGFTKIYNNGLLANAKYYDENSKLLKKVFALFNDNGKISKLTKFSPKGEVIERLDFVYDENNKLTNTDKLKIQPEQSADIQTTPPAVQNDAKITADTSATPKAEETQN